MWRLGSISIWMSVEEETLACLSWLPWWRFSEDCSLHGNQYWAWCFSPTLHCKSCIIAKPPPHPFPLLLTPPASWFLELVHTNICRPFAIVTLHGKCYFIIFLDDHTHFLDMQLLATRDQVLDAWKRVLAHWENKFGHWVNALRSNNGGEYISMEFKEYLWKQGIEHHKSVPYIYQ